MVLKKGDRGEAVRQVQRALRDLGFDIDIDGNFGKGTRATVIEFQRKRSLQADGKVGPVTLRALGLDSLLDDDPKDAGEPEDQIDFDFELEDVEVPPAVQTRVDEYIDRLTRKHDELLDISRDALAQFETTMRSASAQDADPDILGTMLSTAFNFAVDQFISRLSEKLDTLSTALAFAKAVFEATTSELERAGRASASLAVGNWIKDQRVAIDQARRRFDQDDLQEEMSLQFLEASDRQRFLADLQQSIERVREEELPTVSQLEQKLYEQWINAHFRTIGKDSQGCIEFRYEYEDNAFDFVSCTVEAPSGDKIETALNRLLEQKLLPGVRRPIDLKVRKRGCFFVEGLGTGTVWSCGWLDQDNQLIHRPIHDDAQEAIAHLPNLATSRFRR